MGVVERCGYGQKDRCLARKGRFGSLLATFILAKRVMASLRFSPSTIWREAFVGAVTHRRGFVESAAFSFGRHVCIYIDAPR